MHLDASEVSNWEVLIKFLTSLDAPTLEELILLRTPASSIPDMVNDCGLIAFLLQTNPNALPRPHFSRLYIEILGLVERHRTNSQALAELNLRLKDVGVQMALGLRICIREIPSLGFPRALLPQDLIPVTGSVQEIIEHLCYDVEAVVAVASPPVYTLSRLKVISVVDVGYIPASVIMWFLAGIRSQVQLKALLTGLTEDNSELLSCLVGAIPLHPNNTTWILQMAYRGCVCEGLLEFKRTCDSMGARHEIRNL